MKNKLKLFVVSMILSLCLFTIVKHGPEIVSSWLGHPATEYCKKAKECVLSSIDIDRCEKRVEMLIKLGETSEEEFLKCNSCVIEKSCLMLLKGECREECNR